MCIIDMVLHVPYKWNVIILVECSKQRHPNQSTFLDYIHVMLNNSFHQCRRKIFVVFVSVRFSEMYCEPFSRTVVQGQSL